MSEILIPAVISKLHTLDPGEIRGVQLRLPREYEIEGKTYPIRDEMRPGTAFLAKPFGARTGKYRRRMYTRSNCYLTAPGLLETFINDTHEEKADTSTWWQTEQVEQLRETGGTVDVRVELNPEKTELVVYENTAKIHSNNLRLEPDVEWTTMKILGIAFSTGITPFLAHLRYMKAFTFGRSETSPGAAYTLIVSVRNPRQLMDHEELLKLEKQFPENFAYHPVLTREWPEDWSYSKGRIIRKPAAGESNENINLSPILNVVPNILDYHIRMCGNRTARDQLVQGFEASGQNPLSFRYEVW